MSVRTRAGSTSYRDCGRPPERPSGLQPVLADEHLRTRWRHGGVVPPQVASVELEFAAKRGRGPAQTLTAPTSAGDAYRGRFAGRVRFFLTDGPSWSSWLKRYRGADGAVVGADESDNDQPLLAAVTLATTRDRGTRWRLRATAHPELAPLPAERARLGRELCLTLARVGSAPSGNLCLKGESGFTPDLFVHSSDECPNVRLLVRTSPRVRSAYAVLGDGRRARVDLRALPARLGFAGRAGALLVRSGVAVRRMVALDASGDVVQSVPLGLPPAPAACGPDTMFGGFVGLDDLFDVAGPVRVTAHDDGPRLCLSLGDLVPPRGCTLPPVWEEGLIHVRRSGGETHVLGVVPADVASVELGPARGKGRRFTVPTQAELPGYDGQYRGQVRFVTATLPGSPDVSFARHRSAAGTLLELGLTTAIYHYRAAPVPLPGSRPQVEIGSSPGPAGTCIVAPEIGVVPLPFGFLRCAPVLDQAITAIVSCAPRGTSVYLSGRAGRATARLSGGRRVRSRILRVGSGPLAGTRVQAITVGARARIRTVVAGRRHARLALPPAARQCGYSTAAPLTRR